MFTEYGMFVGFYFYPMLSLLKFFGVPESSIDLDLIWMLSVSLTLITIMYLMFLVNEISGYISDELEKARRRKIRKREKGY